VYFNRLFKERIEEVEKKRKEASPTVPSLLGEEKEVNPFLRVHEKSVIERVGCGEDPICVLDPYEK